MSIETDFLAVIAGDAAVAALVGAKVAIGAAPESDPPPYVVVTFQRVPEYTLDGDLAFEEVFPSVQCWATTAAQANAVADAVTAALHASSDYAIEQRSVAFDPDTQLDAAVLTCQDIAV